MESRDDAITRTAGRPPRVGSRGRNACSEPRRPTRQTWRAATSGHAICSIDDGDAAHARISIALACRIPAVTSWANGWTPPRKWCAGADGVPRSRLNPRARLARWPIPGSWVRVARIRAAQSRRSNPQAASASDRPALAGEGYGTRARARVMTDQRNRGRPARTSRPRASPAGYGRCRGAALEIAREAASPSSRSMNRRHRRPPRHGAPPRGNPPRWAPIRPCARGRPGADLVCVDPAPRG